MSPLLVGVVGYGYTGKIHTQSLLAEPGARLTAVADSQPERLENLPPGVRDYANYEDLLRSEVDAVSICLPTYLHCKVALEALECGKHVLVEKPIAVNVEEAERMLRAARDAGRVLYVGKSGAIVAESRIAPLPKGEAEPRVNDWVNRLRDSHINTPWIRQARRAPMARWSR